MDLTYFLPRKILSLAVIHQNVQQIIFNIIIMIIIANNFNLAQRLGKIVITSFHHNQPFLLLRNRETQR